MRAHVASYTPMIRQCYSTATRTMAKTQADKLSLYRALLRAGYAAVGYDRALKEALRRRVRDRFEQQKGVDATDVQIRNTLEFLNIAGRRKGLEHNIVRNLCELDTKQALYDIRSPRFTKKKETQALHNEFYDDYHDVCVKLNAELDLCL
ncbi:hypothetical protein BCR43DRAFT_484607 [Syncephalastrum racemosum]|uniref:Complex 1 LYR protein domain-containing protein n=1 Tax=Syncephalastrum racemosum TaxID=13706 RepID=A0A1X2HMA5_SYNRA|nr:hypothetical protein BCR43DRAFT_484607 [Syncephalastrum racemosum]